jgi:hypothetical protein
VNGDFSPTFGLQGDGTSKYIINGFLTNGFSSLSHSIFVYSSAGLATSPPDSFLCGSYNNTGNGSLLIDAYVASFGGARAFRSGGALTLPFSAFFTAGLLASGSVMGARTGTSTSKIYQNGGLKNTNNNTVNPSFSSLDFFSFCVNSAGTAGGFSPDRRQVEAFAQGLNDAQAQALHDLTTTYVNALIV